MEINGIKIAKWAETEFRRKARANVFHEIFLHVRLAFILLLIATGIVVMDNHEVQVQQIAYAGLNQLFKKPAAASDHLRDNALKRENEINAINEQPKPQSQ